MTVESTQRKVQYAGDDSQTTFPFTFPILEDTDLTVTLTSSGIDTIQVLDTNYSVPVSGSFYDGGQVEMVIPPATGETLTIERIMDLTQETDYVEGDAFTAQVHEEALDKTVMIDQQLQGEIDRCIQIPASDGSLVVDLPTAALRAEMIIWFDASGNVTTITFDSLLAQSQHDVLQGLTDDDHPQYLLVNGSRSMSGNLNMGNNNISNANRITVNEQMVIPTDEPTSLVNGSIWIA